MNYFFIKYFCEIPQVCINNKLINAIFVFDDSLDESFIIIVHQSHLAVAAAASSAAGDTGL